MSNLTYEVYNKRSFVVYGDREKYGSIIKELGGRWNSRLKNGPGWTVFQDKEPELKKLIEGISETPIESVKPKKHTKKFHRAISDTDDSSDVEEKQTVVQVQQVQQVQPVQVVVPKPSLTPSPTPSPQTKLVQPVTSSPIVTAPVKNTNKKKLVSISSESESHSDSEISESESETEDEYESESGSISSEISESEVSESEEEVVVKKKGKPGKKVDKVQPSIEDEILQKSRDKEKKKSSVFVVGRTAHTHEVLGSLSESWVCAFVLIVRAASLKENLLGDHVVADKHRGIDTGFLRHAMITPVELAFGKVFLILFSPIGIGSTRGATSATVGATRCARRGDGRTATSIAAARASMVASNVAPDTSAATVNQ